MITNARQYNITKRWLDRFEQASVNEQDAGLPARARQALQDQYESQAEELRAELAEYDKLRRGEVSVLELDSLEAIPEALIRARTAAGISQAELAARLGLKKQQIQRYEATRYAGVDLNRLQATADALGVQIHERIVLPAARKTAALPSLAAALKRAGLTLDELAGSLAIPPSVILQFQRGRIDPATVPAELLDRLGVALGVDTEEVGALIGHGSPAPELVRAPGDFIGGQPRTRGVSQSGSVSSRRLVSFREALAEAPGLTEEYRRIWLN